MDVRPKYVEEKLNEIAKQQGFTSYSIENIISTICDKSATSSLGRVVIRDKISGTELFLVLKVLINKNYVVEFWNAMKLFEREINFYTNIWPKMKEFQNKHRHCSTDKGFNGVPHVFGFICDRERNEFLLVLEDLQVRNYHSLDPTESFDTEHLKLALTELAKFNAISFAMRDQEPNLFHQMKLTLSDNYVQHRKQYKPIYSFMKDSLEGAFETLLESDVVEKEKLGKIKDEFITHMEDCVDLEAAEPFGVISHGDLYSFNLLFKHDKNNYPKKLQLVDWQISRFGSLALDLINFLFVSTTKEMRAEYYETFIEHYYKSLRDEINKLGSNADDLITYKDLQNQILKFGKFAVLNCSSLILWLTGLKENIAHPTSDIIKFVLSSTFKSKIFTNPSPLYKSVMRNFIIDIVKYNYL